MMNLVDNLNAVVVHLVSSGIPLTTMEHHGTYVDIQFDKCRVSIEPRPLYCNRGRYIVKVDQFDPAVLTVDSADGFPRYYFGAEACASEIGAWARARDLRW